MRPLASLPDHVGTLVLHAALDPVDDAVAAWEEARRHLDLQPGAAPREVHRLLPLVFRNLADAPTGSVDRLERLRLRHRHTRTRAANEARIALAARWLAHLHQGGVPATVLKGIPLALRDYGDVGVRPMADIDLLVAPERATRALDLLEAAGWRDVGRASRTTLARLYHGSGMVHPEGGSLDLHWQLSGFVPPDLGLRTEPLDVGGFATTTLDRTDTVLHVCLHGAWNGSAATTRWVADAVTVLRAAARAGRPVDAERLLEVAATTGVGAILGAALAHVEAEHQAPVPRGLVDALRAQPAGRRRRRAQRTVTLPRRDREAVDGLRHLRAYWTYTRWTWPDLQAWRTFPAFLSELWGLDSPRGLPRALLTRPVRRLVGRRSRAG